MIVEKEDNKTNNNLENVFSGEQIRNISSFGDVLRQIRARLKSEGISIEDARLELLNKKHAR